ncbi:hypothetical protein [Aulosira sp. FACHB-615]|uniref:hypothetical protein n=1 Tax=Aulosira sp. FACHB-615 TaxID=2692777 RepID=UPI00168760CD|nr:hypothetical protein [Aulosira sp. FACHB-615]MBD2488994.1 hypothetical protein [Aulosira sp. FACHB-615]
MCICDVEMPDYDEETWEQLYDEKQVTAESDLRCCECNYPILAGSLYKHIHGSWDGEWSTYHQCLGRDALGDRFMKETDCCYGFGTLYDELINSDLLCRDEEDEESWVECERWLKVVCQNPLKVEEAV